MYVVVCPNRSTQARKTCFEYGFNQVISLVIILVGVTKKWRQKRIFRLVEHNLAKKVKIVLIILTLKARVVLKGFKRTLLRHKMFWFQ